MWQDIAVGAIVALAAGYAAWYWLPATLRKRLGALRPGLGEAPSCGACSDCGGCAAPVRAPEAPDSKTVWMAPKR
ncbi:hypothetical protein CBP36_05225 [Acidovorax carolinensis]|uniref:FeoB-associated Cys-rich membrane protein n=1 Tax=Acidovorax carolinensis TaxID=553814 RepID=A0A240UBA0_9BURK|nr:hypothetical protein [Acidovorax carolinensis]ART55781.1 hypothetical protein CBP35_13710 [Acidovorax carolinensis]ART58343.1 hypothetical protein CBP36_05225 [Acidovorax carolinensis]